MESVKNPELKAGMKVTVTQQIPFADHTFSTTVKGTVVSAGSQMTGSWFAGARQGRLWLDRLTLQKDDGEQVTLNLDQYAQVKVEA